MNFDIDFNKFHLILGLLQLKAHWFRCSKKLKIIDSHLKLII